MKFCGFTLIELVVVIAILGILAALAIPRLTASRLQAEVNAHNANVRTIEGAAAMFLAEGDTAFVSLEDSLTPKYLNANPNMPSSVAKAATNKTYSVTIGTGDLITVKPGLATLDDKTITLTNDN